MSDYYELVIKGDDDAVRGFLAGLEAAAQLTGEIYLGRDHPINTHHLRDILTLRGDNCHLVTNAHNHKILKEAIAKTDDVKFELVSDRKIERASFDFEFETFNKTVAEEIRAAFEPPPAGVKLTGYRPVEERHPDAKGIEMYTPAHEYSFRGKGTAEGDIEKLLKFRQRLDDHDFIDVKDIHLEV